MSIKFSKNWGEKKPQNAKQYLEWDLFFFDDWDTGRGQLVASPSLVLGSSSEKDFPQSLCACAHKERDASSFSQCSGSWSVTT